MPVIPATQEAEAGELPEPRRRRLRWAEIAPLHSCLGNKSETPSQKKKKKERKKVNILALLSCSNDSFVGYWSLVDTHSFRILRSFPLTSSIYSCCCYSDSCLFVDVLFFSPLKYLGSSSFSLLWTFMLYVEINLFSWLIVLSTQYLILITMSFIAIVMSFSFR